MPTPVPTPARVTDKLLLEILRTKFSSIAETMGHVLQRTSHTAFVNEIADFGAGLCTVDGEFFGYPSTLGTSAFLSLDMSTALTAIDDWQPGDIAITNDPYTSGSVASHLCDVHLYKPVFIEGRLAAFAWAYVHSTDVGGKVPGSLSPSSNEIFQEGMRIAPAKLYRASELDSGLLRFMLDNCRVPTDNWGDIKAIVAALNSGEAQLVELVERYGRDVVFTGIDDVLAYAEERATELFRQLPDGQYEFSDFLDDDFVTDNPVRFHVCLTVADGRLKLDYSRSDVQSSSAFNIPSLGRAHPWLTFRLLNVLYMLDPSVPVNAGLLRPVEVVTRPGSIVDAEFPAAVGLRTTSSLRVMDALQGALVQALPEQVPAAASGAVSPVVVADRDPDHGGRRVMTIEPLVGGAGGSATIDGVDARDVGLANLRNNPIEIVEADSSLILREYAVRIDSGGPGLHRGGTGTLLEIEARQPETLITARGMERQRFRAWGLFGGGCGELGRGVLNPGRDDERLLRKIDLLVLDAGDVLRLETPGGGGWGDPAARDPEVVLEDVLKGAVSLEGARRDYGVVLRDGAVDLEATLAARAELPPVVTSPTVNLGPERRAYDERWPPAAYDHMLELLHTLPATLRAHAKSALVKAVDDQGRDASSAVELLDDAWERYRAGALR